MQSSTRHQLKQDKFAATVEGFTTGHKDTLSKLAISIVVLVIALGGMYFYQNSRNDDANTQLGIALRTLNANIRAEGAPADPNVQSFASAKERATEAHKLLLQVNKDFSMTDAGKMALYMAGTTSLEVGDNATGEKELKDASDVWLDKDVAALARFALANFYRDNGKTDQAIELLKNIIDAKADSVPRATAQLALADIYESQKKPADAIKIYEDVVKEGSTAPEAKKDDKKDAKDGKAAPAPEPTLSAAAQAAKQKIDALKNPDKKSAPAPAGPQS